MAILVFDNFSVPICTSSLSYTFSNETWGPPSMRIINLSQSTPMQVSIKYQYSPSVDLRNIVSISVLGVTGFAEMVILPANETISDFYQSSVVWNMSPFSANALSNVQSMHILISTLNIDVSTISLVSTPNCIAKDTMILMDDKSEKAIQDIKIGDKIFNSYVANIIRTRCMPKCPINITRINENSLGVGSPNRPLIITSSHNIMVNNSLIPSMVNDVIIPSTVNKSLIPSIKLNRIPGVKHWKHSITAEEILPKDDESCESLYSLYNLQLTESNNEFPRTFIGNSVVMESIPIETNFVKHIKF